MSAVLVVALVAWFFANISNAIQERDIPHGFEFLSQEYQTPIGEHFIPYESSDTFLYALVVAATNTIAVSVVGVVLATLLGIVVGVARLSGNWIVAKLAMIYVEFFRNVPLLVQLLFWFYVVLALPPVREGYAIAERLYINNGGVSLPWPSGTGLGAALLWVLLAVVAVIVGVGVYRLLARREVGTGWASYPILAGCVAAVTIGAMAWLAVGAASGEAPFVISSPEPPGPVWTHQWRLHHPGRSAGAAVWAGDIYRVLYLRNRARWHPVCRSRPDRGGPRRGPVVDEHPAPRDLSPSPARHHPTADQSIPEPGRLRSSSPCPRPSATSSPPSWGNSSAFSKTPAWCTSSVCWTWWRSAARSSWAIRNTWTELWSYSSSWRWSFGSSPTGCRTLADASNNIWVWESGNGGTYNVDIRAAGIPGRFLWLSVRKQRRPTTSSHAGTSTSGSASFTCSKRSRRPYVAARRW